MEKSPYCVNSEEGLEMLRERFSEKYPNGLPENYVPRITGECAVQLVAELRAHDIFRAKSLERSGGKVIG
jgi:hypothetical protein